jgi:hypothetical protein
MDRGCRDPAPGYEGHPPNKDIFVSIIIRREASEVPPGTPFCNISPDRPGILVNKSLQGIDKRAGTTLGKEREKCMVYHRYAGPVQATEAPSSICWLKTHNSTTLINPNRTATFVGTENHGDDRPRIAMLPDNI